MAVGSGKTDIMSRDTCDTEAGMAATWSGKDARNPVNAHDFKAFAGECDLRPRPGTVVDQHRVGV